MWLGFPLEASWPSACGVWSVEGRRRTDGALAPETQIAQTDAITHTSWHCSAAWDYQQTELRASAARPEGFTLGAELRWAGAVPCRRQTGIPGGALNWRVPSASSRCLVAGAGSSAAAGAEARWAVRTGRGEYH